MPSDRPIIASEGASKRRYDGPRYQRVAETYWPVVKLRRWSDDEIILFLYVITCKHRTLEGFYVLPIAYIATDLGWNLRRVQKSIAILIKCGVIAYDSNTEVILIRNALKYQTPDSSNVVTAVIARVKRLPYTILMNEFIALAKVNCRRDGTSKSAQYLPHALEEEFKHVSTQVLEQVSELLTSYPKPESINHKSEICHQAARTAQESRSVGMESANKILERIARPAS